MALGVMGLNYDYFYSLTPRVFFNIHEGYNLRVELEYKDNWLRTRKLMFAMLKPHLKRKDATETDLFCLPWENENVADKEAEEIETFEQAEKIYLEQKEYWAEIDKRRNQINK